MPVCDLIVSGKNFAVDKYLETSPFKGKVKVFHRGELGFKSRVYTDNKFSFTIADSEDTLDDFFQQIFEMLKKYEKEIMVLNTSYEVEEMELLIGIFWKATTVCSSITLPPSLLFFAGKNKISITMNTYAASSPSEVCREE